MIIQIARRLPNRHSHAQQFRNDIFRGGLPGTARNGYHRPAPFQASPTAQLLQRTSGVRHTQDRAAGGNGFADKGSGGPALKRGIDKAMAVVILAFDRKEEIAWFQGARVDAPAGDNGGARS
jgi:hypothetical protein